LQDLPQLEALLTQHRPAMMVFDPLQSFLGPGVDMNRAHEMRPLLDPVNALCKRYGCTPCYVRHHGKTDRDKAIHSALGSIDITANVRSALALYSDPDDPKRRILAHAKQNGRPAPSLHVRLVGTTVDVVTDAGLLTVEEVRVDWDGLSDMTADDLSARQQVHGGDAEEAQSALEQAREFLHAALSETTALVSDLFDAARQAGITQRTLRRAKDKEGVRARRVPEDGKPSNKWAWEWYYPTGRNGDAQA